MFFHLLQGKKCAKRSVNQIHPSEGLSLCFKDPTLLSKCCAPDSDFQFKTSMKGHLINHLTSFHFLKGRLG